MYIVITWYTYTLWKDSTLYTNLNYTIKCYQLQSSCFTLDSQNSISCALKNPEKRFYFICWSKSPYLSFLKLTSQISAPKSSSTSFACTIFLRPQPGESWLVPLSPWWEKSTSHNFLYRISLYFHSTSFISLRMNQSWFQVWK